MIFIWLNQREIFSWLLLLSYSTDAIDGFLVRKLKITSARGSQLDSFGDQITFIIGLIGLFYFEYEYMMEQLILIIIVLIPYLIPMGIAVKKYGKTTAFHTYLAKLSAICQDVFVLWTLFFAPYLGYFIVR